MALGCKDIFDNLLTLFFMYSVTQNSLLDFMELFLKKTGNVWYLI